MHLAIGLNSGSSFDGIDAALVEVGLADDGTITKPRFVHGITLAWPEDVATQVLQAFDNTLTIFALTRLNYTVGAVFSEAAQVLMSEAGIDATDVAVIGFDGQTIYQEPPEPAAMAAVPSDARSYQKWTVGGYACGLQIGEPGVVAVETDVPVVTQFRPVDHALGGTGAPLMQFLDYVAFRDLSPIATLNVGGISNIQVVATDRAHMRAFDCGPGNVMIDHAMARLFGRRYDQDGDVAAQGTADSVMLADLLRHPFFTRSAPRCAWRLDFGSTFADGVLDRYADRSREDIVATLTRFSAVAIGRAFRELVPQPDRITQLIASGGGVRNATLLEWVAEELPAHVFLVDSGKYGYPAPFKEAVKFAVLAFATIHAIGDNIPDASGARQFGVLGKLVRPPSAARALQVWATTT